MKRIWIGFLVLVLSASVLPAQELYGEKGFELGIFQVRPEASLLGAYDNRVVVVGNNAEGDTYGEAAAGVRLDNTDARFDVSGKALIGYRFYNEFTGLDNSFYDAGGAISSAQNPLKLGLSAYLKKSLDYDTAVDAGGGDLAATLTRNPSTRISGKANMGYEKQMTEKTTIMPGYDFLYYLQNFDEPGRSDDEWVEHRGSLELGYGHSKKTVFTLSGYYSLQITEEEDGHIGTVAIGARSRATDKTRWIAEIGVAAADYELSGTGESVVSRVRSTWQATDKVSIYVFGGNYFQPRNGIGGAQLVYRLGYGANWRIVSRWNLKAQALHDYQESLTNPGGGNSDGVKHFFTAQTSYDLTRQFALSLTGKYINDELEVDQAIISLSIGYSY